MFSLVNNDSSGRHWFNYKRKCHTPDLDETKPLLVERHWSGGTKW